MTANENTVFIVLCLTGFNVESVTWKDEYHSNQNFHSGTLPDGEYPLRTTKIYYCCRRDGHPDFPINLPTEKPFVLFKAKYDRYDACQAVTGMKVTTEFFYWDCDDDHFSGIGFFNWHSPVGDLGNRLTPDIYLEFCYYSPSPGKKVPRVSAVSARRKTLRKPVLVHLR